MNGYEVKFNVYANSQDEVDELVKAVKEFITHQALNGRAVTASKLLHAITSMQQSSLVKTRIDNYFK